MIKHENEAFVNSLYSDFSDIFQQANCSWQVFQFWFEVK